MCTVHLCLVSRPAHTDCVLFIKVRQGLVVFLHAVWGTEFQEEAVSTAAQRHERGTQNCCVGQRSESRELSGGEKTMILVYQIVVRIVDWCITRFYFHSDMICTGGVLQPFTCTRE